jgi:hypothetical protein
MGEPAAIWGERYRPARMVARHLSCRAPSGRELPIVVLGDVVIAPATACEEPGLAWLELERLPRLSSEIAQRLERLLDGMRIGCWSFCAPLERWNEAAKVYPCLAIPTDDQAGASHVATCELPSSDLSMPQHNVSMDLRGERPRVGLSVMTGDRLPSGSRGVVELFLGIRQVLALVASGLALVVSVYYLVSTADWLWRLRDGITGGEVQGGLVLMLAAIVLSGITRTLGGRPRAAMTPSSDSGFNDRHTVVSRLPCVYRAGVTLQLVAFLGFVIW